MHDSINLGTELMISLEFNSIYIDTVYLYLYGCVDIILVHSGDEKYCQSFCWQ